MRRIDHTYTFQNFEERRYQRAFNLFDNTETTQSYYKVRFQCSIHK
jgi:hypothetical protein